MKKPVIGITCDYDCDTDRIQLYKGYYEGIFMSGGLPFLVAYTGIDDIPAILSQLDGLLLSGGQDVDPVFFNEGPHPKIGGINPVRDQIEIELCRRAVGLGIPVLGICRGIQVINIAMEGTIYQDLESQWKSQELFKHSQNAPGWYGIHEVKLLEGSRIRGIMGVESVRVNSFHHQAVKDIAPGFKATGWSCDGVVEVVESVEDTFVLGVQWHPERMLHSDERMLGVFKGLVEAAERMG